MIMDLLTVFKENIFLGQELSKNINSENVIFNYCQK